MSRRKKDCFFNSPISRAAGGSSGGGQMPPEREAIQLLIEAKVLSDEQLLNPISSITNMRTSLLLIASGFITAGDLAAAFEAKTLLEKGSVSRVEVVEYLAEACRTGLSIDEVVSTDA
ncbi:MAG: hypothetical protein AB7W16_04865 [Candidatus Obscuribacterales bacterium]